MHRVVLKDKLAGFDFRQIEDGIDDLQQMLASGFDLVEPVNLRWIQSGTAQEIGHAGDGVERGADFMAHVGDKAAFRQIGGFGGFLGCLQFGRSSIHQFLKVVTIVDQCQFALAAGGDLLAR